MPTPRAIGSGTITFGLVTIPVKLYTAASAKSVSFATLHKHCGSRLKQQYVCAAGPACRNIRLSSGESITINGGKGFAPTELPPGSYPLPVEREDTEKAIECSKDEYVIFSDEDLEAIAASRPAVLELAEFVPADTVDLAHVEKLIFLGPDAGGARPYRLLASALAKTGRIGVGRFAQRGKDMLALVRPYQGGLILQQCFYADEVRSFDDVLEGVEGALPLTATELKLASALIGKLSAPRFCAEKYADTYAVKIALVTKLKVAGEEIVTVPVAAPTPAPDLVDALRRSLPPLESSGTAAKRSSATA